MDELIPINQFGIFADKQEVARVDSRFVAKAFGKQHRDVLKDIQNLIISVIGTSSNFCQHNFALTSYLDDHSIPFPCYKLTKEGFIMLVAKYHSINTNHFKELYLNLFNEMEEEIKVLRSARIEFPILAHQLQLIHDHPKPYHYSNECNLINRIVLGASAKQFREQHNLKKGTSIRPYLSLEQKKQIDDLQKVDIGLLIALPNYQERKQKLEWYYAKNYGIKELSKRY